TSVAVSETRRFDTLEAHQGLEHLLGEAHPFEGRALQRERDQRPIDVRLGGEHIRIECGNERTKLFQGWRSCPHTLSLPCPPTVGAVTLRNGSSIRKHKRPASLRTVCVSWWSLGGSNP